MGRNTKKPRSRPPSDSTGGDGSHLSDGRLAEGGEGEERQPKRRTGPAIIHQDESLILISKPAGQRVDDGDEDTPSVLDSLTSRGTVEEGAALEAVYPLDVGASGLLVLTRRPETRDRLRQQIADGRMELRHLVLVRGRPGQEAGTISRPLFDPGADGSVVRPDEDRGQAAVTDWRLREFYVGFALLECIPRTTVRSQIRVHLQTAGMPLVVDPRYGGGSELLLSSFKADYRASRRREERPLIARLTLHAQSVRLAHPRTGAAMTFEAAMPKDMRATIHQLDRFGRVPSGSA
jgi:23S rRNA-/tRNA-specific pseudouridylate synthase